MKILKVTDEAFKRYGRVVDNVDFTDLVEELKKTPVPADVAYEPSVEALEALPVMEELSRVAYGEMPIQIGYSTATIPSSTPWSTTGIPKSTWRQRTRC